MSDFSIPWTRQVHGILQAIILEWVAFPFSRGSCRSRDWTQLLHCRQILCQLSHKGSPRILEWVVCPFSSGSSQPRNRTGVSCIAGGFFTNWAIRKALSITRWCLLLHSGLNMTLLPCSLGLWIVSAPDNSLSIPLEPPSMFWIWISRHLTLILKLVFHPVRL